MRVSELVEVYLEDVAARARLAQSSRARYMKIANDLVAPGMGDLQIREITVPAINRFLTAVARNHGYGTAKSVRSVLSGMVQLAIDHGALRDNPVRQARRLEAPPRRQPRALTVQEHATLLDRVATDAVAQELDLVDLVESSPPPEPGSARRPPSGFPRSTSMPGSSRSPPP
jgi:site-specific recombinase XerD